MFQKCQLQREKSKELLVKCIAIIGYIWTAEKIGSCSCEKKKQCGNTQCSIMTDCLKWRQQSVMQWTNSCKRGYCTGLERTNEAGSHHCSSIAVEDGRRHCRPSSHSVVCQLGTLFHTGQKYLKFFFATQAHTYSTVLFYHQRKLL